MRTAHLAIVLIAALPIAALAEDPALVLSPVAAFADPDTIPNNIKTECRLPDHQAEMVRKELESQGFQVSVAKGDAAPGSGRYLQLRIKAAYSSGNAWIGHHKQVSTSATLFEDGKEVAKTTLTRRSGGGAFAGFKGSCAVLERCTNTLAVDITKWLKRTLDARPAHSAMNAAAPAKNTSAAESEQQ